MSEAACMACRLTRAAEMLLRVVIEEPYLELADAAALGNAVNALVRWRHRHRACCPYCEGARASEAQNKEKTQ